MDDVTKRFGSTLALDGVSLTVADGRLLTLLGPSGSGKSTLIRCLAGIEHVDAGTIAFGGHTVADAEKQLPPDRRDLAMVFQDFALWPHMTVMQNVAFALRRRRTRGPEALRQSVETLERVGLANLRDRYPPELSGGEQQRVALARALVARPDLLLFDEPLSSLDANLRERLRVEIGTLVRETGATCVYITHDQGEAFALGDEVGVLAAGRLVQHGTPEHVYGSPVDPFVANFTGIAGSLHGRVAGFTDQRDGPPVARVAVPTGDGSVVELHATSMSVLAPDAAAVVMLRPSAARLCPPDAAEADLQATIHDVAFRGVGYEYVVRLGSGEQLAGLVHTRRHARGDRIGVHVSLTGCFAYAIGSPEPSTGGDPAAVGVGVAGTPATGAADTPRPGQAP